MIMVNTKKLQLNLTLFNEGGKLASSLREAGQRLTGMCGFKIKIQERGGTKPQQLLPNTNRWKGSHCGF